ncbi:MULTISPECIES: MFS transporter [unclassified Streptomyces]|uniref:MFS transporter n=1 Tax=unclassified Streptomyces TaxID=2593676 RepID=UPI001CB756C2|nr:MULTISPECIES: MFS transporter [unclassified Streptomyces]MBD0707005.1 hypothetical protein [Streptomyces sp. CBMA291]MBD0712944.1 hypothetical protein [Streptomyces sp. CBMA370]
MSSSSVALSYAAVLRTRHSRRTFGAALLGRLSNGMVSLSLVLAVKEATGSYAMAGTVMAVFGLTGVSLSLVRAGLVDRHGPRRVLPLLATAYAVLLTGLAFATTRPGVPGVLLAVLAGTAGATTPPLGPVMRTLWSFLIPDRRLLQRAYSLDGVAEELLFVTGPLLVGLLIKIAVPSAGLVVSAALVLTGALSLALSPAVREREAAEQGKAAVRPHEEDSSSAASRPLRGGPGLRQAVAVAAGVGMCLGGLDLLVIAFAEEHEASHAVPLVLAALSGGSAIGGLVHGAVSWRTSSGSRLGVLAIALGLTLAVTGLSPHPYVLVGWAALCGVFVAPAITTAYLIADECADPGARTRAGAWVNTALNAGSAGSTAAVGLLVGRMPLPVCFALAATPVVLSAATALKPSWRSASAA